MRDYEYKDEGGRFLCRLHHRIRCDECHYVSDLRDENKRYREAMKEAKEMASCCGMTAVSILDEALEE